MNLQSLKLLEQAKLVYNIKNKLLKTNTQVSSTGEHHEYNVRNKNLLRNKYARSEKGQDIQGKYAITLRNILGTEFFFKITIYYLTIFNFC